MTNLQNLLNDVLLEENPRVIVSRVFSNSIADGTARRNLDRLKTPGNAKSLLEFYDLVRQAKDDYENRANTPDEYKIIYTEEEPDSGSDTETVTFSLVKREPGAFSQGKPFEGNVRNLKPMLREVGPDETNPGYNYAINGYWFDNVVKFTCWARTNKAANVRAMWFEAMMEDYMWWFRLQGTAQVLFWGRDADMVIEVDNNKWYGRPLNYFVRTESLRVFSEKQMEEIIVNLSTKSK